MVGEGWCLNRLRCRRTRRGHRLEGRFCSWLSFGVMGIIRRVVCSRVARCRCFYVFFEMQESVLEGGRGIYSLPSWLGMGVARELRLVHAIT